MNAPPVTGRTLRRTACWLAAGVYLAYLFTSSGGFECGDAVLRYETARSWLSGRGGALPSEMGWSGGAVLPDGRVYTFFGPLQSVLMVPFLLAVRLLPAAGLDRSVVETFAISLGLFPLVSTAVIALLFLALDLLGFRRRDALLGSLAIAFASLFWHYARMGQEENLVALGYALWLFGAARLAAGRRWPAVTMAVGATVALTTRWATLPLLGVLFAFTLILLLRHRREVRIADLAAGAAVVSAAGSVLLLYNHARFDAWLETGYGLWYAHEGIRIFAGRGYFAHLAALLLSPYRGLLVYSPIVVAAAVGLFRLRGMPRLLGLAGFGMLLATLLLYAAFHFWAGGHSWGPRFLASPQVLLAPALAALFAHRPRAAWLLAPLAVLQLFSTILPASTEEYARYNLERQNPGFCTDWRFACTAAAQRLPRGLGALVDTLAGRPGVVLSGRPLVGPEAVLNTSDYHTLYWWPVRVAFRLGRIPLSAALALCACGLIGAALCLHRAWASLPEGDSAAHSP